MVRRFDIWMISLDPVIGSEIRKTRPCVIVSPNEVNQHLKTVTVVPLTSSLKTYPTRVPIQFQNKQGEMAVGPNPQHRQSTASWKARTAGSENSPAIM